jgi:hypothetical protein
MTVHHTYTCNSCGSRIPSENLRRTCLLCDDYHCCSDCARAHHDWHKERDGISATRASSLPWRYLLDTDNPTLHFLADSLFAHFTNSAVMNNTMSMEALAEFYTSLEAPPCRNPTHLVLAGVDNIRWIFGQVGCEHIFDKKRLWVTRNGFMALIRDLVRGDPDFAFKAINALLVQEGIHLPEIPRGAFPKDAGPNLMREAIAKLAKFIALRMRVEAPRDEGGVQEETKVGPLDAKAGEKKEHRKAKTDAGREDSPFRLLEDMEMSFEELTSEENERIAAQVLDIARNLKTDVGLHTLVQGVFEHATRDSTWAPRGAILVTQIYDVIPPHIQDDKTRDPSGVLVTGPSLFLKYLIGLSQETFQKVIVAGDIKDSVAGGNPALNSNTPKRRLGIVLFLGELINRGILNHRSACSILCDILNRVAPDQTEETWFLFARLFESVCPYLDQTKASPIMDQLCTYSERILREGEVKDTATMPSATILKVFLTPPA